MIPRTVLTRSGPISLKTAIPVNTVQPRTLLNNAGPMKNVINNAYSTARRPFNKITAANNSNFNQGVNTVKDKNINTVRPKAVVNTARPKTILSVVKGNKGNAVKASACWETDPILQTMKKLMEDLLPLRELKLNLFSVSDMCDKKNSILFTDTECVDLSLDFKLTDESHVLLKVPRKDNMYSVDIKNFVPQGGLTCFFAKATPDESNLWQRRLGHVNFKTINKLVKGNLVRGLPLKLFEINQTCVAYQKGKQHGASCIENLIDLRVKVIRCDNGTEFKNRVMNQFCEIKGRKPTLSFMRPFGYPVTILNTIDHLGKFDGNDDEGFFVGYSTNSKEFRVFNSRTRIVEENMHFKDSPDAGFKPSREEEKKDAKDPGNEDSKVPSTKELRVNKEKDASVNSTNTINTVSPTVNVAGIKDNVVDKNIVYGCADDPNMPELE
ncbi:ribonuclease H-like domain-containing protein [Tanacetum coccineum]